MKLHEVLALKKVTFIPVTDYSNNTQRLECYCITHKFRWCPSIANVLIRVDDVNARISESIPSSVKFKKEWLQDSCVVLSGVIDYIKQGVSND